VENLLRRDECKDTDHFLERLTRNQHRKIFLILDNLRFITRRWSSNGWRTHRADRDLLSAQLFSGVEPRRILNAISNKELQRGSSKNQTCLTQSAVRALRSVQKQPQRVRNYFRKRCQLCGLSPAVMAGSIIQARCVNRQFSARRECITAQYNGIFGQSVFPDAESS